MRQSSCLLALWATVDALSVRRSRSVSIRSHLEHSQPRDVIKLHAGFANKPEALRDPSLVVVRSQVFRDGAVSDETSGMELFVMTPPGVLPVEETLRASTPRNCETGTVFHWRRKRNNRIPAFRRPRWRARQKHRNNIIKKHDMNMSQSQSSISNQENRFDNDKSRDSVWEQPGNRLSGTAPGQKIISTNKRHKQTGSQRDDFGLMKRLAKQSPSNKANLEDHTESSIPESVAARDGRWGDKNSNVNFDTESYSGENVDIDLKRIIKDLETNPFEVDQEDESLINNIKGRYQRKANGNRITFSAKQGKREIRQ